MINSSIENLRLASQQLSGTNFSTPCEILEWMGAIQAQDYRGAKIALSVRLAECSDNQVEEAFNRGEILRTHVLRPTWHFTTPENIRMLLSLTAEKIKSSTKSRDRDLEITEELYAKTNNIICAALENRKYLTREELSAEFERSKIVVDSARLVHFMMRAELDGIVCSGPVSGKNQTYALMSERVPPVKPVPEDEALAKLVKIYFTSRCPATLQDFAWWSGLSLSKAKQGMNAVKPDFIEEKIDGNTYYIANQFAGNVTERQTAFLLPAFDEYLIAYKDRNAALLSKDYSKVISSNGVFRPIIVVNGKITGLWKKSGKKISTGFFVQPAGYTMNLINQAIEKNMQIIQI